MKKQFIFIAVFSVVVSGFGFANISLAVPGEPVNGVVVKLGIEGDPAGIEFTATTDENGAYTFTNLPPGKYKLTIPGQPVTSVTVGTDGKLSGIAMEGDPVPGIEVELGIANVGTLPTSRWYFFKEWGRGITRIFTFGSINKAELELKITNEKAAEILKIQETYEDEVAKMKKGTVKFFNEKSVAISKAVENYEKSQERLMARMEKIKETSQNPNVDKLLDKLVGLSVKHIEIFDRLEAEGNDTLKTNINTSKNNTFKVIHTASEKDEPEKFASRLEKVLEESKGGDFKHFRSIEFIDDLEDAVRSTSGLKDTLKPQVRISLEKVRSDFLDKLSNDLEKVIATDSGAVTKQKMWLASNFRIDTARDLLILEELRQKAEEKAKTIGGIDGKNNMRVADVLGKVSKDLEKTIVEGGDIKEKAEEQIKRAEEIIEKLKSVLENITAGNSPVESTTIKSTKSNTSERITNIDQESATKLFEKAQGQLAKAKEAFSQGKYGEAFGQARAAEVIARNGLSMLVGKVIRDNQSGRTELIPPSGDRSVPSAPAVPVISRCEELKKSLAYLDELLKAGKISEVDYKLKYESVKKELAVCAQQVSPTSTIQNDDADDRTTGTILNDDTASSLKAKSVQGDYDGDGQSAKTVPTPSPTASPKPIERVFCTQEWNPVCGADGKTHSNECMAKSAGVAVKYKGECRPLVESQPIAPTAPRPTEQKPGVITETGSMDAGR